MRFFKVELNVLNLIRQQVMGALEQPNSRADEPWPIGGTYNDGVYGYVAIGQHHLSGEFAPLLSQFINLLAVEEIDSSIYFAVAPKIEDTY